MISQIQTPSNASSHTTSNYSKTKRDWRSLAYELKNKHNLNNNAMAILLTMINLVNLCAEGVFGQERLAKDSGTSVRTVRRVLDMFRELGLIETIERRGWNQNVAAKDRTNITILLFVKHELTAVEVKMAYDINNPNNLRDLEYKQTYDEYVSNFANLEKKGEKDKRSAPKVKQKTHIDNEKLKAEPEAEIKRAVLAYNVPESEVEEITRAMRQKQNVANPGGYLVGILKNKLKNKTSAITYFKQTETEQERINRYERERECLPPDHKKSGPTERDKQLLAKYRRIH